MEKFVPKDYKASDIKKIDKANNFDKADLPNCSKIFKNSKRIPLVTSYN